jgi:hypothetical protein
VAGANAELAQKQREVLSVTAELAKTQNELILAEQFSATQINAKLVTAELAQQQRALLAEQLAASEMQAKLNASLLDDMRVQERDNKLKRQGKQKDKQENAVEQATKIAILETTLRYEQLRAENSEKETQIKLEYERALKAAMDAEKEKLLEISRQDISYMRAQSMFEMMSKNMQSSSVAINPQMQLAMMLGLAGPITASSPGVSLLTQHTTAAVPLQVNHEDNPKPKKSKKSKKKRSSKKKRKDSSIVIPLVARVVIVAVTTTRKKNAEERKNNTHLSVIISQTKFNQSKKSQHKTKQIRTSVRTPTY